jgi:hypothetical protein
MKRRPDYPIQRVLAWGLLLVVGSGCGSRGYDKYIPTEDKARQALEASLNAWRDGKKPGVVEGAPVTVEAVDSRWQAGQKLREYEILNEEPNQNGPRVFSVRLTLSKPAGRQETVRYFVVGKEPLWVYREDDYKAPAGM